MRVTAVPAGSVGASLLGRWSDLQASTPFLDSPYLAPEFVRAAADVRDHVEVAILEDGAGVIGFFPFERGRGSIGYPVGRSFSDFQAVIAPPAAEWDGPALVRGCGLVAWRFDHLLAFQQPLRAFHWSDAPSPYVDLSQGFEGYRSERKRAGSREIEKTLYEARKAERRAGPLRFEFHSRDEGVFATLLRWKSAQFRAAGIPDLIALPWVTRFLDRIRGEQGDAFSGVLSALYVGDALAAAHLGMRTRTALHYWLPAYNPELAPLSPGQLCFLETARAAAAMGIRRIDLGKGPEPYKTRLMSGSVQVAEGAIHLRAPVGAMWRAQHRTVSWARGSALRHILRGPARWLRRAMVARGA
jgi:CelD/BcsL family acetyltransferase involved in cellulose biosynthesis